MSAPKSKEYHEVLDHLDANMNHHALSVWYEYTKSGRLNENEFRLLYNAFQRRGVLARTV